MIKRVKELSLSFLCSLNHAKSFVEHRFTSFSGFDELFYGKEPLWSVLQTIFRLSKYENIVERSCFFSLSLKYLNWHLFGVGLFLLRPKQTNYAEGAL